ncbi:SPOR domain-containing protein [Vogesella oryzae]|uniref:SPOR domain-containing protein n=1 Tax=Vogesella oryzae TaxID=1735285 RepID=UPI001582F244|nr:SPOR domain-containing protein [Vogesella oryzae]
MALSTHDELLMLRKRARRRLVGAIVLVTVSTAVLWNVVDALPEQAMQPESVDITGLQTASAAQAVAPKAAAASRPAQSVPATELLATLPPEDTVTAQPAAATASPSTSAIVATPPAPAVKPKIEPEKVTQSAKTTPKPVEKAKPKEAPKPDGTKTDPMAILEGRDTPKPAIKPEPEAAKPAADGKRYSVQLAALSDPAKVDALRSKLAASGVSARFSKVQTSKGEVTRVRVGPFASRAEADASLRRLAKAGVTGIVVTQ